MARRGARMIEAMIAAAPVEVRVRERYRGECDILMTYGMGHPVRRPWWQQHRAAGGRCIGWDLGYWRRDDGMMRCTIDHDHPQAMLRPEPPERWDRERIALRSDGKANGPIVLVGLGAKTVRDHGMKSLRWERGQIERLKAERPARKIVFRPKRPNDRSPNGTADNRPIEAVLNGASLVVCRHSNVAVDACIAGVPVQCEDGAAHALYANNEQPSPDERLQFLRSLAWWQWHKTEAADAWTYLLSRINE